MNPARFLTAYLLCTCCSVCAATVGPEQARTLAEEVTGTSLAEAAAQSVAVAGSTLYEFTLVAPDGRRSTARVDAQTGLLYDFHLAFTRPDGTAPAGVTEDQAIAAAQEVASRALPDGAGDLTWSVRDGDDRVVLLEADGPRVGDPPRSGLSPHCEAMVSLVDGVVYSYSQVVPQGRTPIDPTISSDQAVAIAQAAAGGGECPNPPALGQHRDRLTWYVTLRPPGDAVAGAAVVRVDGLSGEVLGVESSGGADGPPETAQKPPQASRAKRVPAMHPHDRAAARNRTIVRWSATVSGSLALAGVVFALWRRRQSR